MKDMLFDDKFDIVPSVRDQGKAHTCVFQAISGGAEMALRRNGAVRNKLCETQVLTDKFISEYGKTYGKIPEDSTRLKRLPTTLQIFLNDGLPAKEGGEEKRVKIREYRSPSFSM